jgi:G3E family GTPase
VGFADQIFISKSDLVSAKEETDALVHRLKHMNPRAPQKAVHFGDVTLKAEVFDLRGFNLNAKLDIDPDFLKEDEAHDHHDHANDHEHGEALRPSLAQAHESHGHHHHTDDDVKSFVFKVRARVRSRQAGRLPGRRGQHLRPEACFATRACCTCRAPSARSSSRACTS